MVVLDAHGVLQPVQPVAQFAYHPQIAFAEGGRTLFRHGGRGEALNGWRWDGERWAVFRTSTFPTLAQAAFSPDGSWLAWIEGWEHGVSLHDMIEDRALGRVARILHDQPTGVAFAPDGALLLRTGDDCVLVPWRLLLGVAPR
jgi:hypothetical protein